jgi:hypothetical protein
VLDLILIKWETIHGGIAGTVCFIIIVSFAIYVTLDLNQPDRGLVTASQEPIQRLLSTMSQ